jgi:predicted outer membrane repeat protein
MSNTSTKEGGGTHGHATLIDSVVMSNTAGTSGGGIYGSASLIGSTVAWNSALNGEGGGVRGSDYWGGDTMVVNSTISGNRATGDGGGIYYNISDYYAMQLRNATITANTADSDGNESGNGGGIVSAGGTITLANTIVAGNFDNSPIIKYPECDGTIGSDGYNLILTVSPPCLIVGDTTGNIIGVNPNLSPLADNGGPTPTHALWPGNPAVDNGNPTGCTDETGALLTTDQRGYGRPVDGGGDGFAHCDIGAFELGVNRTLSPTLSSTLIYTDTQGNSTTIHVPVGAVTDATTLTYSPLSSVTPPSGLIFAGHAFVLDAYRSGLRLRDFAFQSPVTITIRYSNADANGTHESQLVLLYRNGNDWQDVATMCTPPSTYSRDPIGNSISVRICHLSEYALFGSPVAPSALAISGPITASVNMAYSFTATTNPLTATVPITYIWEATDQASRVQLSGITDTAVYSWTVIGTKTISLTAENLGGVITALRVVTVVVPPEYKVYLPVLLRNR